MSTLNETPDAGDGKVPERKLPSWMISRENGSKSHGKKSGGGGGGGLDADRQEGEESSSRQGKAPRSKAGEAGCTRKSSLPFSKLLEGVVFVLSGFVNPERATLRSQALEMGAEYQPDWISNCTLLVCAFPNTPKFRQVEADRGTIVAKEWITECYTQKKLVEIDSYLMHAGRAWRRSNTSHEPTEVRETLPPRISQQSGGRPNLEPNYSAAPKAFEGAASLSAFSPLKVKRWAADDFKKTISWLESQDDKPELSEIKNIAVEGILMCLQDAIDLLNSKEDLNKLIDQWSFIPHVVQELINTRATVNSSASLFKENLHKQAITCKDIYERELRSIHDDAKMEDRKPKATNKHGNNKLHSVKSKDEASGSACYDSDETIEMTEEEIEHAYERVASKLCKT